MVSAKVDPNLAERETQAALDRWAPRQLQEAARIFDRLNSGEIRENRLCLSVNDLKRRGKGFLQRQTTLATGGAGTGREIAPTRNFGLDAYGSALMADMTVNTVEDSYQRPPVVTVWPDVSTLVEGADFTAGDITIAHAPPDSDLKPAIFATALNWSSAARAMADAETWTALDEALKEHCLNAIMAAVFSDAKAKGWVGIWHGDFAAHATERRNDDDTATRPAVSLADVTALESRVARTGQRLGPIVYVCDGDTWEELGRTPRSAGDSPLRLGDWMLGRPCYAFDSTANGKERMLSCIALGAVELTFWQGSLVQLEYVPQPTANKFYKIWSSAVLDVVRPADNVALSYSASA